MDLSGYCFFPEDKKNICEHILSKKIPQRKFAGDHKLKKSRIAKWMKQYKTFKDTGIDTFCDDFGGRPPILDSDGSITLCRYLKERRQNQDAPNLHQFKLKVIDEVKASAMRKGIANPDGIIARRTIYNIMKRHDCSEGKCQFKTRARIVNEADPRNAYTMICMMWAFCSRLDACMCFNWDATQFYITSDAEDMAVYIKGDQGNIPLTRESSGMLGVSIKYYHFHNSEGETAQSVYIIADNSMDEDAFFVQPIVGLGNSTEVGSKGFLCWCKTRNCNEKFYRWFAKEIVIPFIKKVREVHQPKVCALLLLALLYNLISYYFLCL